MVSHQTHSVFIPLVLSHTLLALQGMHFSKVSTFTQCMWREDFKNSQMMTALLNAVYTEKHSFLSSSVHAITG